MLPTLLGNAPDLSGHPGVAIPCGSRAVSRPLTPSACLCQTIVELVLGRAQVVFFGLSTGGSQWGSPPVGLLLVPIVGTTTPETAPNSRPIGLCEAQSEQRHETGTRPRFELPRGAFVRPNDVCFGRRSETEPVVTELPHPGRPEGTMTLPVGAICGSRAHASTP